MKVAGNKKWIAGSFSVLAIALASALAVHYEGSPHRAYWDPYGKVWTICDGHTAGVKQGDTATDAECLAWLQADMGDAYAAVDRCITAPLTLGQAAAFTDAAYNLGPAVVCGSTLQRLANSGQVVEACHQLPRWDHADGKRLPGLVARRGDERDLCTDGLK